MTDAKCTCRAVAKDLKKKKGETNEAEEAFLKCFLLQMLKMDALTTE